MAYSRQRARNMESNLTEELRWKFAHDTGVLFPERTTRRIASSKGAIKARDTKSPLNVKAQRAANKRARKTRKANRK